MTEKDNTEEALSQISAARTHYQVTEAAHEEARADLIATVVAALKAGIAPSVVARTSEFTDAYVRKVARDHGIAPARPGIKPGTRGSKKAAGQPAMRATKSQPMPKSKND